jgi:hypothetical protein
MLRDLSDDLMSRLELCKSQVTMGDRFSPPTPPFPLTPQSAKPSSVVVVNEAVISPNGNLFYSQVMSDAHDQWHHNKNLL